MINTAGIDLSLTATGVARSDGRCAVFGQTGITTKAWATQLRALENLRAQIVIFATTQPYAEVAVIEGLDQAQPYGGQIQRSWLWCAVASDLIAAGVHVYVAPSPQVKMYATGKGALPRGREGKKAVIRAVAEQWPHFEIGQDDNKADAAVCCALAAEIAGHPMSVVTAEQARALEKTLSVFETKTRV